MEYTAAVDIWSVGCILGELIGRSPMFRGTDYLDQIRSICQVLGTPTDQELSFIPPAHQAARDFIKARFPNMPRQNWQSMLNGAGQAQCDLLDKMLQFDPNSRLTALDALRHPYLAEQYCEEDEIFAEKYVDWSFDDMTFEPSQLQCLIYHEAAARHPEILARDGAELEARGWLLPAAGGEAPAPTPEPVEPAATAAADTAVAATAAAS
mmetsp:Transcript_68725/g.194714  ORF Transcript_68725/g.194714 Transcript_68725/m.194714 type:complete len:209 (-) Transcript_68725:6-632(-)